jgi:hypothetical protein
MRTKSSTPVKTYLPLDLPSLPVGYFWRVTEAGMHMDSVQLRKKVLFFSVTKQSRILSFYATRSDSKKLLGAREPKSNIEAAATALFFCFSTGRPAYEAVSGKVEIIPIPKGVSKEDFENSFDMQYDQYRKDYK